MDVVMENLLGQVENFRVPMAQRHLVGAGALVRFILGRIRGR